MLLMQFTFDLNQIRDALLTVAAADTAYNKQTWLNRGDACPLTGHCFAAAYVVQQLFGGQIISGAIEGIRHGWNCLPDGKTIDLTCTQFKSKSLTYKGKPWRAPKVVNKRFLLLFERVKHALCQQNIENFSHLLDSQNVYSSMELSQVTNIVETGVRNTKGAHDIQVDGDCDEGIVSFADADGNEFIITVKPYHE